MRSVPWPTEKPSAGFPALLDLAGSLKTRPALNETDRRDSDSSSSCFGRLCGARLRDNGERQTPKPSDLAVLPFRASKARHRWVLRRKCSRLKFLSLDGGG
jgi:hypothetical protein